MSSRKLKYLFAALAILGYGSSLYCETSCDEAISFVSQSASPSVDHCPLHAASQPSQKNQSNHKNQNNPADHHGSSHHDDCVGCSNSKLSVDGQLQLKVSYTVVGFIGSPQFLGLTKPRFTSSLSFSAAVPIVSDGPLFLRFESLLI